MIDVIYSGLRTRCPLFPLEVMGMVLMIAIVRTMVTYEIL